MDPPPPYHAFYIGKSGTTKAIWENLVCHALAEPAGRRRVLVHGELPACQLLLLAPAVFAVADGAAVAAGKAEAIPTQIRLLRRSIDAGKAALGGRQGTDLVLLRKFAVDQQLTGVIICVPQGKGNFGAAGNSAEGGFAGQVLRIKNRKHISTSHFNRVFSPVAAPLSCVRLNHALMISTAVLASAAPLPPFSMTMATAISGSS